MYRIVYAIQQTNLMTNLQQEVIKVLSQVKIRQEDDADAIERQREQERANARVNFQHQAVSALAEPQAGEAPPAGQAQSERDKTAPFIREMAKVGRNDPCPCGSGKKYKVCHGKIG